MMISTLFIVALLLFFAGFLAGSESALTSLSRLLIEQLVEDNSKYKKRFDRFVENPARYLNVLLLVRKSCELTATALVATAFVEGAANKGFALAQSIVLMVAISSGGEKQPKEPGPITRKRKEPPKTTGRKSDGKNDRVKIKVKEE